MLHRKHVHHKHLSHIVKSSLVQGQQLNTCINYLGFICFRIPWLHNSWCLNFLTMTNKHWWPLFCRGLWLMARQRERGFVSGREARKITNKQRRRAKWACILSFSSLAASPSWPLRIWTRTKSTRGDFTWEKNFEDVYPTRFRMPCHVLLICWQCYAMPCRTHMLTMFLAMY